MDWQPIETIPDGEGPYIVACDSEMAIATQGGAYKDMRGGTHREWRVHPVAWEGSSDRGGLATLDFIPTHWMPLPEPPIPNQNKGE